MKTAAEQTLATLRVGQSAIIQHVAGTDSWRQRLLDLGLTPGARVTLTKCAPGGDPLILKVRGYPLTLRKNAAKMIVVQVLCA